MSDVVATTLTDLEPSRLRSARLLRAGTLLAIGLVIAFSAPLHEQTEFARWTLTGSLAAIGLTTLVEAALLRYSRGGWLVSLRGTIAIVGAIRAAFASTPNEFAAIVAVWAVLTALTSLVRVILRAQPRAVGLPSALLGVALAFAAILSRDDLVALIGFFGAYAVLHAVFLGIFAFDSRNAAVSDDSTADPFGDGTTTTRPESTP